MHQVHARTVDVVAALARDVLENYATADGISRCIYGHDSGPIVLTNVAHSVGAVTPDLRQRVVRRWFQELPSAIHSLGSFGGMGGFIAAVRALIAIDNDFAPVLDSALDKTRSLLAAANWRTSEVAWVDYDLFRGPAGL